ncbi:MAG: hypothetical protein M3Y69_08010 [Verrucomicrobiota bacterium]|nr:hypothetical protein [Verrucomicrobiota bacterium]
MKTRAHVVALISVVMLVSCGPSRELKDHLARFVHDAARLVALTSQGVSYNNFGDQLATVRADFDLLSMTWPPKYNPRAKAEFKAAMLGWELVHEVWTSNLERPGNDELTAAKYPELIEAVNAYAPEKVPLMPPEQTRGWKTTSLSFQATIRVLMSEATRHFNSGIGLTR